MSTAGHNADRIDYKMSRIGYRRGCRVSRRPFEWNLPPHAVH
jgi:hypothetical protein